MPPVNCKVSNHICHEDVVEKQCKYQNGTQARVDVKRFVLRGNVEVESNIRQVERAIVNNILEQFTALYSPLGNLFIDFFYFICHIIEVELLLLNFFCTSFSWGLIRRRILFSLIKLVFIAGKVL